MVFSKEEMILSAYWRYLFVILISTQFIQMEIYRGNCRREAQLEETDIDKVLMLSGAGFLKSITSVSVLSCVQRCIDNDQCKSINFKSNDANQCQLLSFDKNTTGVALENAPGWRHFEPREQVGSRCRFATCDSAYQCVETCNHPLGYECVHLACTSYAILSDITRSVSYSDGATKCDNRINSTNWYRFVTPAGTKMLSSCPTPSGFQCQARWPGWLQGTLPSVAEGIVDRTVCIRNDATCCAATVATKVKNCGEFFVYYLTPLIFCGERYCGEV